MKIIRVGLANQVSPLKLECFHWLVAEWEVRDFQKSSRRIRGIKTIRLEDGGATCKAQEPPLDAESHPQLTVGKEMGPRSFGHGELNSNSHLSESGSSFSPRASGRECSRAHSWTSAWGHLSRELVKPVQTSDLQTCKTGIKVRVALSG